jgi:signal transduction histidine kinase
MPASGHAGQKEKSILIVDDEAIIRDLCGKVLKGYRILEAGDGEEALQIFGQGGIDVVLTDVMMPNMGGIELLGRLKEADPTLVVIVMTGFAEKEVILNALKSDADDFIPKPINLLQLKTAVDKALVKKALKEEIANLKSLDRMKSNFLSLISHKFRTPITAISLFLQNLSSGVYDPDDQSSRDNLKLIYQEACYLEQLVAELLTFSQIMERSDTLEEEPCSLNSLILEILASSPEAARKPEVKIFYELAPLSPLSLDRVKLGFAIRQVIDNAYKFSKEKGRIEVTLQQKRENALLVVRDDGIGIARDDLPKVFEKFYQVDNSNTGQVRGIGLGLYYAREFVQEHGGSIAIDSEAGKWTQVTITLPIR